MMEFLKAFLFFSTKLCMQHGILAKLALSLIIVCMLEVCEYRLTTTCQCVGLYARHLHNTALQFI